MIDWKPEDGRAIAEVIQRSMISAAEFTAAMRQLGAASRTGDAELHRMRDALRVFARQATRLRRTGHRHRGTDAWARRHGIPKRPGK